MNVVLSFNPPFSVNHVYIHLVCLTEFKMCITDCTKCLEYIEIATPSFSYDRPELAD